MKSIINPSAVTNIFNPILGDRDEMYEKYGQIDSNNEQEVKNVIREEILPYLNELNERSQNSMKLSLRYALSLPSGVRWRSMFEGSLPPFNAPDDAMLLFLWAWEEWCPGEDYHIDIYDNIDIRGNPESLAFFGLNLPPKIIPLEDEFWTREDAR